MTEEVNVDNSAPTAPTSDAPATLTGADLDAPAPAPVDPIVDGTVDNTGTDNQGVKSNTTYPDGYDADTYNLETGEVKMEAVLAKIKLANEQKESFEKQAKDMRKLISKGKAPESTEAYLETYEAPEGLERYYTDDESNDEVKEVMTKVAEMAKDMGLNTEQFKSVADVMNETMAKYGVLDSRTDEQIAAEKQEWLKVENQKLSADPIEAKEIIDANVKFIKDSPMLNDDQKKFMVEGIMDKGAMGISVVNVFRELFGGKGQDLPTVDVMDTGLASDDSLAAEYYNSNTPTSRRQEIVEQRAAAGRKGGLPLPR